jgi:predicted HAD superfamily Cof-like phosphohydrolase
VWLPGPSNYEDVHAFHLKFDLPPPVTPRLLDEETFEFRRRFLEEELTELVEAQLEGDMVKAADALVDLVYVALGTAVMMGLPWQELWDNVQRANMAKVRAQSADESKRGSTLDVVKPPGWNAPDHSRTLLRWGWRE